MPLQAILEQAAFDALPDETVLGKDSFIKDEKTNTFRLAMDGAEAGKLAIPLQEKVAKLEANNKELLDQKIKTAQKVTAFEKLGKTPEEIEEILKSGKTPAADEIEKNYQKQIDSLKTENQRQLDAAKDEADTAKTEKSATEKHLIATIKKNKINDLKTEYHLDPTIADYVLASFIDVVYDEALDKYFERVVQDGEVAYKGTAFKTPAQLVEELRADKKFSSLFTVSAGGGGGAPVKQGAGSQNGRFVNANDADAIGANLEKIASGEVKVV